MVFCTSCGKENKDESTFCYNCGKEITGDEFVKNNKSNETFEREKNLKKDYKNPWVAGLLNLIIAGLGFLYVDEYAKAICGFLIVVLAAIFGGWVIGVIALVFIMAWSSDEARKYNQKMDERNL